MITKETLLSQDTPIENYSRGLLRVEIPELGNPIRGKVRDNWVIGEDGNQLRLIITTDRQSAFVRTVCTAPGKGQISNLMSAYWFEQTKDIVPNHVVAIPHPNILIAKQVKSVLPIEIVLRRFMARGSTPTSVYQNYIHSGRREIYGIKFPEGIKPDQEFPMGTILTPTTKAKNGHDEELTDIQANNLVDSTFGDGVWDRVKSAAFGVFERARVISLNKGLILADTKMEFGLDVDGDPMLIDELLTPECSRYWRSNQYMERFNRGENQDIDKDILINWLVNSGFNGVGQIPQIPSEIIDQMAEVYAIPYKMITGNEMELESGSDSVGRLALSSLNLHLGQKGLQSWV
jgi:phosphoribosylaminoimidazole-succinocarboxamide synthase